MSSAFQQDYSGVRAQCNSLPRPRVDPDLNHGKQTVCGGSAPDIRAQIDIAGRHIVPSLPLLGGFHTRLAPRIVPSGSIAVAEEFWASGFADEVGVSGEMIK